MFARPADACRKSVQGRTSLFRRTPFGARPGCQLLAGREFVPPRQADGTEPSILVRASAEPTHELDD